MNFGPDKSARLQSTSGSPINRQPDKVCPIHAREAQAVLQRLFS